MIKLKQLLESSIKRTTKIKKIYWPERLDNK